MADNRVRLNLRVPEKIIKDVEEYQEKHGITTRTSAFLELIRKGLESDRSKE